MSAVAPRSVTGRGGDVAAALAYARTHRRRWIAELAEFVRFPSVSAQPARAADVARCAQWLAAHLRGLGLRATCAPTTGHPLVRAEWRGAPGRPTVLLYGHYDVQPPEPLQQWTTPPFEPSIRGGAMYGRGASDDKGQLWIHVKALEAWLRTRGSLPVNVVCLFEGEEEAGSAGLLDFLRRRGAELGADVAVISDMRMRAAEVPALTYALRGALSLEIELHGPREDLHSGLFGGAVRNPLEALSALLAGLHDGNGRVAIAGFYASVRAPSPSERAYLKRTGPTDAEILESAGTTQGWGEPGYTLYERTTLRPALSINGIAGGYAGPGAKAVIPGRATAKLSFRLVPDQEPGEIERLVRQHLARHAPAGTEVRVGFGARPARIDPSHPAVRVALDALRAAFGREPVLLRSGGTIPVVSTLAEDLGILPLLIGFARPDDRLHAPDERFHLSTFHRGVEASIRLMQGLGA